MTHFSHLNFPFGHRDFGQTLTQFLLNLSISHQLFFQKNFCREKFKFTIHYFFSVIFKTDKASSKNTMPLISGFSATVPQGKTRVNFSFHKTMLLEKTVHLRAAFLLLLQKKLFKKKSESYLIYFGEVSATKAAQQNWVAVYNVE